MAIVGSNMHGFGMLSYKLRVVLVHIASLHKLRVECNHGWPVISYSIEPNLEFKFGLMNSAYTRVHFPYGLSYIMARDTSEEYSI